MRPLRIKDAQNRCPRQSPSFFDPPNHFNSSILLNQLVTYWSILTFSTIVFIHLPCTSVINVDCNGAIHRKIFVCTSLPRYGHMVWPRGIRNPVMCLIWFVFMRRNHKKGLPAPWFLTHVRQGLYRLRNRSFGSIFQAFWQVIRLQMSDFIRSTPAVLRNGYSAIPVIAFRKSSDLITSL